MSISEKFSSYSASRFMNLGFRSAEILFLTPYAVTASFEKRFTDSRTDENILYLRQCVGDLSILSVIGKIEGLNDKTNPPIQMKIPEISEYRIYEDKYVPVSSSYQGQNVDLRLYGEHDNLKRINKFWEVFIYRIKLGDSVSHALFEAAEFLKIFGFVSHYSSQSVYKADRVNERTDSNFTEDDPRTAPAHLQDLIKKIFMCVSKMAEEIYKQEWPEEFEEDSILNKKTKELVISKASEIDMIADGRIPTPGAGLGKSPMMLLGLGAFAVAGILLAKK